MRGRFLLVLAAIVVMSASTAVASASGATSATSTGRYIVVLKDSVGDPALVANQQATKWTGKVGFVYRRALKGYSVTMPTANVAALRADPRVQFVDEDNAVSASFDQPPQVLTREARRIAADLSSTASGDGTGAVNVNVAVLDSGIDATHPDLNVVGGADCAGGKGTPFAPVEPHGTSVAGVIAAADNAIGMVGIAPGARLWAVRVLKQNGQGTDSEIICGLDWVVASRVDADPTNDIAVANMSLGGKLQPGRAGPCSADARHAAVCRATAAGVVIVGSAGNEQIDLARVWPAAFPEVLTVTAMTDFDGQPGGLGTLPAGVCEQSLANQPFVFADDTPAGFSNFATLPSDQAHSVAAPGVCVQTTYPGGLYSVASGTSFSAPHVAGVVALCIASGPCAGLTPAQIIQKIAADAAAYNVANPSYGFIGDPQHPIAGKYYGNLIRAAAY